MPWQVFSLSRGHRLCHTVVAITASIEGSDSKFHRTQSLKTVSGGSSLGSCAEIYGGTRHSVYREVKELSGMLKLLPPPSHRQALNEVIHVCIPEFLCDTQAKVIEVPRRKRKKCPSGLLCVKSWSTFNLRVSPQVNSELVC